MHQPLIIRCGIFVAISWRIGHTFWLEKVLNTLSLCVIIINIEWVTIAQVKYTTTRGPWARATGQKPTTPPTRTRRVTVLRVKIEIPHIIIWGRGGIRNRYLVTHILSNCRARRLLRLKSLLKIFNNLSCIPSIPKTRENVKERVCWPPERKMYEKLWRDFLSTSYHFIKFTRLYVLFCKMIPSPFCHLENKIWRTNF